MPLPISYFDDDSYNYLLCEYEVTVSAFFIVKLLYDVSILSEPTPLVLIPLILC